MTCPACLRTTICPPATAALNKSAAAMARDRGPISPARILVAVVFAVCAGWAGWNALALKRAPAARPAEEAAALAPADRRQQEILKEAIGLPADPALGRVYDEINTRHFNGRLPVVPVVWEPRLAEVGELAEHAFTLEGMFGHIGENAIILLNPRLARDQDSLRRALSHEMVHAWLYSIGDSSTEHGPAFQKTLARLAGEGAFAGIPGSPAEREHLREWLESESARLDSQHDENERETEWLTREARDLEQALADLNARRPTDDAPRADDRSVAAWRSRRDSYNRRVAELRERADRYRADLEAFNARVERYNLMTAYPSGLDAPAASPGDSRTP
jgi:hypothetical protein